MMCLDGVNKYKDKVISIEIVIDYIISWLLVFFLK